MELYIHNDIKRKIKLLKGENDNEIKDQVTTLNCERQDGKH